MRGEWSLLSESARRHGTLYIPPVGGLGPIKVDSFHRLHASIDCSLDHSSCVIRGHHGPQPFEIGAPDRFLIPIPLRIPRR